MPKETRNLPSKKKDRFANAKLAAIPVLLCVLLYVLFGSSAESPQTQRPRATQQTSVPRQAAADEQTGRESPGQPKPWPTVERTSLLFSNSLSNPFADYRATATASGSILTNDEPTIPHPAGHLNLLAQELSQQDMLYRFHSERRKIVMLGEHLFEEGTQFGDAIRVHDIQDQVLVLSFGSADVSPNPPAGHPVAIPNDTHPPANQVN